MSSIPVSALILLNGLISLAFCSLISILIFLVSVAETFKCHFNMHLGHIQLTIVLLLQISQYFHFAGHICCGLQVKSLFSYHGNDKYVYV